MYKIEVVVIIATKNRPELLEKRSLKSVLAQSEIISEVIVIQDYDEICIDQNERIVNDLNTSIKSTFLFNKRSAGFCGAANTGVYYVLENYPNPENVYIAILDDDDQWKANYLSSCIDIINKNPKVDWVATDFYRLENTSERPILQTAPNSVNSDLFLVGNPGIQGSNSLLRLSKLLESGAYDENQSPSNDRDLSLRLCDLNDVTYQRNPIASMIHYAESDRFRYSNPNTKIRNTGFENFWSKHCGRMSCNQKERFVIRTKKLFNWTPQTEKQGNRNVKEILEETIPELKQSVDNFNLYIGVISDNAKMLSRLVESLSLLDKLKCLNKINIIVLCNGIDESYLGKKNRYSNTQKISIEFINKSIQINDAKSGLFGKKFEYRPQTVVGIAQARTMVQKYVGLRAKADNIAISWILDDDMRIDSRALIYIPWLQVFKENGVDVLIGSVEGSSPNPPLNGLRVLLLDLYHNILWLRNLDPKLQLPNRSDENHKKRLKYPDYYYDLSRKHTAHLEDPHWIQPIYEGETVENAFKRLLTNAPLIITGHPLTRPLISPQITSNPLKYSKLSVNRGGNTFILNSKALLDSPNLTIKINGREGRRSDMIWAIINKQINNMHIKTVPFPILHDSRVNSGGNLNSSKVIDEIIGSTIYAALCDFLKKNDNHSLKFSKSDINEIWSLVIKYRNIRLHKLNESYIRVIGLTKALDAITNNDKLGGLLVYLDQSFSMDTLKEIRIGVMEMKIQDVIEFFSCMYSDSKSYADANKHL